MAEWSRGHGRERVSVVQLVCLWFPPRLLWWPWMFRHLGGETRGGNVGGGPGLGSGCCCHFSPEAWLVKTLRQGVCAWCGLILVGELMVQFSLRPGSQLFLLPLQVAVGPLHELLMGCCLGGRKQREGRREGR